MEYFEEKSFNFFPKDLDAKRNGNKGCNQKLNDIASRTGINIPIAQAGEEKKTKNKKDEHCRPLV
jgi:hypothetical protein